MHGFGNSGDMERVRPDRMNWNLKYVPPQELHSAWPRIKKGVEELAGMAGNWWPEDVYSSLKSSESQLYVCEPGFVVITPKRDGYTNEVSLHVWLAWAEAHGASVECIPQIETMARNLGAGKITLHSPRRGFEKTGWNPVMIHYERKLA